MHGDLFDVSETLNHALSHFSFEVVQNYKIKINTLCFSSVHRHLSTHIRSDQIRPLCVLLPGPNWDIRSQQFLIKRVKGLAKFE